MKRGLCAVLCIFLTLWLGASCAKPSTSELFYDMTNVEESYELDPDTILGIGGKDNSLDEYSFFDNYLFDYSGFKEVKDLHGYTAQGTSSFASLKKYLDVDDWSNCFDLVSFYCNGKATIRKLSLDDQFNGLGPSTGNAGFIALKNNYHKIDNPEPDGPEYSVTFFVEEYGSDFNVINHIDLDFLVLQNNSLPTHIGMDKQGRIHIIYYYSLDAFAYYVASNKGELLFKEDFDTSLTCAVRLVQAPSGDLLVLTREILDGKISFDYKFKHSLLRYDEDLNQLVDFAGFAATIYEFDDYLTVFDNNDFLVVNRSGVYLQDINGEQKRSLYKWINHGISVSSVLSANVDESGRIFIVYSNEDGENYIALRPTEEVVPITKIQFAVSPYNEELYRYAVSEFNRRSPSCIIEMKSDYDNTVLKTQLIAGNGPTIIDTSLIGFGENKELWEPLDDILTRLDVLAEINEEAISLGRLNGTLYGIPIDYSILTLLTMKEANNWDYASFIEAIRNDEEAESIVMSIGETASYSIIQWLFFHDIDDNYFLTDGKKKFDEKKFEEVFELIKSHIPQKYVLTADDLINGTVFCEPIKLKSYESIAAYRLTYGDIVNFAGFPTESGASNYITSDAVIAVRGGASKQEKEIAVAFINLLLSYKVQEHMSHDSSFAFSLRNDISKECLLHLDLVENGQHVSGFGFIQSDEEIDQESVKKCYDELMSNAVTLDYSGDTMLGIIIEEISSYYDNGISQKEMLKHIKKRVNILLQEKE